MLLLLWRPSFSLIGRLLQVSGLIWNPHEKEILAGLGHPDNKLTLWRWPSCHKVADFSRHEDRILFMALDPEGTTVCRCGLQ
jgi:cell division cycle 20, cofactor of APC complex